MKRNFTNENFERFLRQNADSFRMKPSERTWKGIANHLNRRKRRIAFTMGSFLAAAIAISYYFTGSPVKTNHPVAILHPAAKTQLSTSFNNGTALKTQAFLPSAQLKDQAIGGSRLHRQASSITTGNSLDLASSSGDIASNSGSEDRFAPAIVDSYFDNEAPLTNDKGPQTQFYHRRADNNPLSIESVINSFKPRTGKKPGIQLYFTPTVSYRKLGENKSYLRSVPSASIPSTYPVINNVNSAVTHKPGFGFEIGVAANYPIFKNVKLRGGLQFNINRYDIKAFNSPSQLATIRLNTRNYLDSFNTITTISNLNGFQSDWLQNFYFQVSAPVGIEFKLRGDEKMQFGIATTIQPTYILGDRAYLISTDYKNYAQVPWLIRRWNVNTSLETFVSYSTGHLQWQVGPQVRYQLLSSFVNKYPVKENLFDFGLKVAISLNKQ